MTVVRRDYFFCDGVIVSKVYKFSDYGKDMSLKVNLVLWLIILYFLRPFILKLSTIQRGRVGHKTTDVRLLKELVYPDDFGFFIAFLSTIPVLILLFAFAKRKAGASELVRKIWKNGLTLLAITAVLNMVIIFVPFVISDTYGINMLGWSQLAVAILILGYLYLSQRVKDTFADFPDDEPETAGK